MKGKKHQQLTFETEDNVSESAEGLSYRQEHFKITLAAAEMKAA